MRRIILIFMVLAVSISATTKPQTKKPKYPFTIKNIKVLEGNIIDGDTFRVYCKGYPIDIRLFRVDTPETSKKNAKSDLEIKYGLEAKYYLISLIANRKVNIKVIASGGYDRDAGVITIGKKNINEELVKSGWAIVTEKYFKAKEKNELDKYLKLQTDASNSKRGFWADTNFYPEIRDKIIYYKK